jgi:hypothetical protein
MSCMADNESSGDPLGLPEEEPVVTEVMEDSPEAENPDMAPEQESNPAAVLDTPAVTPPARVGASEEAPAVLDPRSGPDGDTTAISSQPRMLTRSQSRRAARAGTTLAAEATTEDPQSYREAMSSSLQRQWKAAMQQEYASLLENRTFTPVEHAHSKPIGCKWVYKTKTDPDDTLRYKARIVIKGYEQVQGVDFEEIYAPVSKISTLRYLMACAAQ